MCDQQCTYEEHRIHFLEGNFFAAALTDEESRSTSAFFGLSLNIVRSPLLLLLGTVLVLVVDGVC